MASITAKWLIVTLVLIWPVAVLAQVRIPVYGYWCGPDYPGNPAVAEPPVDALDVACMARDYCTAAQGRLDCGCDLALMGTLRNTRWPNPCMQADARGIYDAIAVIPCRNPLGTA